MSEENNSVTTVAIVLNFVGYVLSLISETMSSFAYSDSVQQSSASGSVFDTYNPLQMILWVISGIYNLLLGMIGTFTGMPDWFNALITTPILIIVIMYLINKI